MKKLLIVVPIFLAACQPTTHQLGYTSDNLVSIEYSAYAMTPTLTPEAMDMAANYCKERGKFANYQGVSVPNVFTAKEVHTFACENEKRNDAQVIAAEKRAYAEAASASAQSVANSLQSLSNSLPTYTTCNTFGSQTSCTSY